MSSRTRAVRPWSVARGTHGEVGAPYSVDGRWRTIGWLTLCFLVVFGTALTGIRPGHATSSVDRFIFSPVADTYVNASTPTTSYGTSGSIWVDSNPQEQSFLRFDLTNISGRTIEDVRLRMYQTHASSLGGRVFSMTSTTWDEAITWNTRPTIDGLQLGSFSAVSTWNRIRTMSSRASLLRAGSRRRKRCSTGWRRCKLLSKLGTPEWICSELKIPRCSLTL